MKVAVVNWIDSRSDDGWVERKYLEMRPAEITTIGLIACETKDVLCVALSKDKASGQLSGLIYIPQRCITSRDIIIDDEKEVH